MAILKHIDFEVPGFGEFAAPPATAALTQVQGAAPPDLPGQGVLRINTAGPAGFLLHDLAATPAVLHTRLMFNATQAAGGSSLLCFGSNAGGQAQWQVNLNAAQRSVTLAVGATSRTAYFSDALDWHTAELKLDAAAGSFALRLDGTERAAAAAALSPTRFVWLGTASAGSTTGPIDVDHLVLADAPIGLPVAAAHHDHAGDPRRWLVVYNRSDADSAAWAADYRARRNIPYANLCGLALPTAESITPAEYHAMRQQIADYLDDNHLDTQVMGVLLGLGVPGYTDLDGLSAPTPIANYLHTNSPLGGIAVNPLHQDPITDRPHPASMAGVRLTGRIDAPDLPAALAMIDRADALINQPLAHDDHADLIIDTTPAPPGVGPAYEQAVTDWVAGEDFARLRLPATIYDAEPPASVTGEAVLWGWRDAAPPPGFFQPTAGRRAICQQFAPDAQPATTLRNASATDWLTAALQAGYAAAAGPSRAYALSALPLPHLFFDALRRGWTLAEAWLVAKPFIRDGLQLVGDPLMTVGFPRAGYDVFGPVDRLEQIDLHQPTAILHAGQHTLQLDELTAPAATGSRYLVRRYDAAGRPDAATASVYAAIQQQTVVTPAPPAWPGFEGWRVRAASGQLTLTAIWPASLGSLGVDRVQLYAQTAADEPTLIDDAAPPPRERRVLFNLDRPSEPTRYRFRVVQGPAVFDAPWSVWVDPAPLADQSLTLLETQP